MNIHFSKMQGLGNDFILVDYEKGYDYPTLAKKMCDRHFGIGADGLIVVNPEDMKSKETDSSWHIYNSDGSEPQMCGNGIRCFSKYVYSKNLINKKDFSVNTLAGTIKPKILDNGLVQVNMGKPVLSSDKIPVNIENILNFKINAEDKIFAASTVSMGNPHCIIFTDENTEFYAKKYGSSIENNELFPEKTNVEFVQILSKNHLKLDVWERGCGITLACGTGSCATAVAGILNGLIENKVQIDLPGGSLFIEWDGNVESPVYMTGDAKFVFEGDWIE